MSGNFLALYRQFRFYCSVHQLDNNFQQSFCTGFGEKTSQEYIELFTNQQDIVLCPLCDTSVI